ncbi:MAG: O-antigen ligase family protein [Elusimicrobia bacterium]|jgi:hypothetical protein|nr:O-antigen ligase family protein [Elusimicrobiota bacterium]
MKYVLDSVFFIAVFGVAVLLGNLTATHPLGFPLYFVLGFGVWALSLYDIKYALGFLALSMLLSPEIPVAQAARRAVVIRFDDLFVILIFITWIAKSAVNKTLPLIKPTPINKHIYYYLAACFLFTGKGIMMGDVNFSAASFYLLKYTEYFMVFWMTYNIIESQKDIKLLLIFMLITAFIVIGYGYVNVNTIVVAPFDREPGSIGGYLILLLGITLGLALYHPKNIVKLFFLAIFIAVLPLLVKTQSRASYIAFIPMIFVVLVKTRKFKKTLISGVLLMIVTFPFLFGGGVYNTLVERVKYTFSGNYGRFNLEPSATARVEGWKNKILNRWTKFPFTGTGITGSGFIDSQYVRTLVELGLIGFTFFIILLYKIIEHLRHILKNTKNQVYKGITLGFLAGTVGLLFQSLTSNTFIIVRIMEPFWFLLAIIFTFPKVTENKYELRKH